MIADVTYALQIIPAKSGLVPHVGIMLVVNNTCNENAFLARVQKEEYVVAVLPVSAP